MTADILRKTVADLRGLTGHTHTHLGPKNVIFILKKGKFLGKMWFAPSLFRKIFQKNLDPLPLL